MEDLKAFLIEDLEIFIIEDLEVFHIEDPLDFYVWVFKVEDFIIVCQDVFLVRWKVLQFFY